MKPLSFTLILCTLLAVSRISGSAQTVNSLSYSPTNGVVTALVTNRLIFTNAVSFDGSQMQFYWPYTSEEGVMTPLFTGKPLWVNGSLNTVRAGDQNFPTICLGGVIIGADGIVGPSFRSSGIGWYTNTHIKVTTTNVNFEKAPTFTNTAAQTRTNLALGWPALTNSNAATSLLGVNTNNNVVFGGTNRLTFTNLMSIDAPKVEFYEGTVDIQSGNVIKLNVGSPLWVSGSMNTVRAGGQASPVISVGGVILGGDGLLFGPSLLPDGISWGTEQSYTTLIKIYGTNVDFRVAPTFTNTAAQTRTNLGIPWSGLTNENATGFRSALRLSAAWLTNTNVTNFRTAIGLGATWLTNTNVTNFRTEIGLGVTNSPTFNSVVVGGALAVANNPSQSFIVADNIGSGDEVHYGLNGITWYSQYDAQNNFDIINASFNAAPTWTFNGAINFGNAINAATTRTNLGLGATWLTNTNVTNFRTAIGLGSANGVTFQSLEVPSGVVVSDIAVNSSGMFGYNSAVNLEEGLLYIQNGAGNWYFNGSGISESGPISFNNTADASITRTNLGLGATWLTNTNVSNFTAAIGLGQSNGPTFLGLTVSDLANTNSTDHVAWVDDTGTFFSINAAATRANLGLPLAALTNTDNATFQAAIFSTNAAPTNPATPNFNDYKGWMGVTIVTNGVTNVFKIPLYQ